MSNNNYYLHFERFSDGSLLHIGVCNDNEEIKIFDVTEYDDNLLSLSEQLLLYVSKNRTENANLYLHNYRDDLRLINKFIRRIERFIIKGDDEGVGQEQGNNSDFTTINLIDSREIINKDLSEFDEEFNLPIKNDIVVNRNYFTKENINKSVPVSDYVVGLPQNEIQSFDTYVSEKQEELKQNVDLTIPVSLPQNIENLNLPIINPIQQNVQIEPTNEFKILAENVNLAKEAGSDNFKINPTNLIVESTYTNTLLLSKGLKQVL